MPEGFLFDTVTCSRWRRGDRMLRRRIEALPMDAALYTSVISVGELTFGIHKAPYELGRLNRALTLDRFLDSGGRHPLSFAL